MSPHPFFVSMSVAAAVLAWSGTPARAADVTPPPNPIVIGAAPVEVGMPGCATCQGGGAAQHGLLKSKCPTCGKLFTGTFFKDKNPYPVTLCPGACFGYFQTQWRKWDEVCPYPYLGMGASDAGRLPGAMPPPQPTSDLPPPRPVEPKKNGGSDTLPPVPPGPAVPPVPPGPSVNKFAP
jgi:hypothetical protein